MLKFNDSNIYAGYIKQLLSSFNLPQCQIGKKDDCVQSLHYIEGNSLYFYDSTNNTSTRVTSYKENDKIRNITKNLQIRSNIYDTYTHEYLGDYLRYIRDYKHLDLMSMYNCFSNNSARGVDFTVNQSVFDSNSTEYTIFVVPVKFNKKYTIAIDWHGKIEICCGFYTDGNKYDSYTTGSLITNSTYQVFGGLRFNHPVIYDKLTTADIVPDYAEEHYLKMFLKIPTVCKSSIVILEGDYSEDVELMLDHRQLRLGRNEDGIVEPTKEELRYLSRHQLLEYNSCQTYLLADRLVEYLSNQAITPIDPVEENIRKLQKRALSYGVPFEHYGVWDNYLKNFIYTVDLDKNLVNKYNDVLAYLDKEAERAINLDDLDDTAEEENSVWQLQ